MGQRYYAVRGGTVKKRLFSGIFSFLLLFTLLFFLLFLSLIAGAEEAAAAEDTPLDTFMKLRNPTVDDLLRLHERSGASFSSLAAWNKLRAGEKAAFLEQQYVQPYAKHEVLRASFSNQNEQAIADIFFSRDAANINTNPKIFERFLVSRGVDIRVYGPLQNYKAGRILGSNGELNAYALKEDYALRVQSDGRIFLARKPGRTGAPVRLHSFEGVITLNKGGNIRMQSGSFDGQPVQNVEDLVIDKQERVVASAKAFGPLVFEKPSLLLFFGGEGNTPDRYRVVADTQISGIPYPVGGTFALATPGTLADGLQVLSGDEASVAGYEIRGRSAPVHIGFVEEFTGEMRRLKRNRAFFDENGGALFTSAGANAYEVATDPASVLRQKNPARVYPDFLQIPVSGSFSVGQRFSPGSDEALRLAAIQSIVGDEPSGVFSPATRKKVREWQNNYNKRRGLRKQDAGWLEPHGRWTYAESDAFFEELNDAAQMAFQPDGGSVEVRPSKQGVSISAFGDVKFSGNNAQYTYRDKKIMRSGSPFSIVTAPFTFTAYDEKGIPVAELKQDAHIAYAGSQQMRLSTVSSSFNQAVVSGETCLPCLMLEEMGEQELRESRCAEFVQRVTVQEGGGIERRYGKGKEAFNSYLGIYGSAWEVSHNIRSHGGTTLYWKEQDAALQAGHSLLGKQAAYGFDAFQEGDIIGMYYTRSSHLGEAAQNGLDRRKNTHVAKVLGTVEESYGVPAGSSISSFLSKELGVKNKGILGNYPVWVKQGRIYERVRLGSDGEYYRDSGERVSSSGASDVLVQKVIVAQQIGHGQKDPKSSVLVEDLGRFFDDNPSFSLYEHLRPNQQRLAEAQTRKGQQDRVAQISESSIQVGSIQEGSAYPTAYPTAEEYLSALYLPRQAAEALEKKRAAVRAAHAFGAASRAEAGEAAAPVRDVLAVSRSPSLSEEAAAPGSSVAKNLKELGADRPDEWLGIIERSTAERVREYGIPSSDASALALLTAAVGIKESGLTASPFGLHKAKRYAEDVFAYTPEFLAGFSPAKTYGYYQLNAEAAAENARELARSGKIPSVDFDDRTQLVGREGSVKHGQRELAKIWSRYVTPEMPLHEKMSIVGAGYNCGEWCPRNAAVQQQLNDVFGTRLAPDGRLGENSIQALQQYARERGIPFNVEQYGDELDRSPVFEQLKKEWKAVHRRTAPYGIVPEQEYSRGLLGVCRKLTPACSDEELAAR